MDLYDDLPFHCATCQIGIAHRPVIHLGLAFCCAGCAADGPCRCSYDDDLPTSAHPEAAATDRGILVETGR